MGRADVLTTLLGTGPAVGLSLPTACVLTWFSVVTPVFLALEHEHLCGFLLVGSIFPAWSLLPGDTKARLEAEKHSA